MSVFIVGIGMDGEKTLTQEGRGIIYTADILIGAERMLRPFKSLKKETFCSYDHKKIVEFIGNCLNKKIAVLMSGDCGFYSGAKLLMSELGRDNCRIICGISSPVYFASKIGLSWQNMKFISLHGVCGNISVHVKHNKYCFFLLGGKITPSDICQRLQEYDLGYVKIYIGENLGYENERIIIGTAWELMNIETSSLSVLIVENQNPIEYIQCGICDDDFIRGSVPMTKSEVRAMAVSGMNIAENDICFDIGCGTGSVTVEMAERCPRGMVYAFDISSEAIELTNKNCRKFGCDNVRTILGDGAVTIPKIKGDIPSKVFIGGSGGRLDELVSILYKMNPEVTIIVTAITIETLNTAVSALENAGAECSVTQVSVARTIKTSRSRMFKSLNPVFIVRGIVK